MHKLSIFISCTHTGFGHKIAADAVASRIEEMYPGKYEIILSNFFDDIGEKKFNEYIEASWRSMLKHHLYMKLVMFFSHLLYFWVPFFLPICHPRVWKKSKEYLKKINPDIIFSTHFFTTGVAIGARQEGLKCPIISLNPDTFHIYPQWPMEGDLIFLNSDIAYEEAKKLGHNEEKLMIVPQVLRKECEFIFSEEDKQGFREKYDLRPGLFTIFMCDGGEGVGNMWNTISALKDRNLKINVIAVAAKNKILYEKLLELKSELAEIDFPMQLTVFPCTDQMIQLFSLSDLFIGKSGPSTVLESLNRNVPVLVNFSTAWTEKKHMDVCVKAGVAWFIENVFEIADFVSMVLQDSTELDKARENIKKFTYVQSGTRQVSEILVKTLEYNVAHKSGDIKVILD